MASFYEKFTDVDSLKNSSSEPTIYRSVERRLSQAGAQATSRTGAIFFQIANSTALACWNIENPFTSKNIVIVAKSELALQYISGIKIKENNNGEEEIWLNTNRLQKTIDHSRLPCEINFRVLRGKVNDLIRNTNCAPTGWHNTHPNFDSWQEI